MFEDAVPTASLPVAQAAAPLPVPVSAPAAAEPLPGQTNTAAPLPQPGEPLPGAATPVDTGYVDRYLTIPFDHLTADAKNFPVYVTIRNPRLVPPEMLTAESVPLGPDGMPLDPAKAAMATYGVLAKLIKDWRVYNAYAEGVELLPLPATAETVAKLPLDIINRLGQEVARAANPR